MNSFCIRLPCVSLCFSKIARCIAGNVELCYLYFIHSKSCGNF